MDQKARYVRQNVALVCWQLKRTMLPKEFKQLGVTMQKGNQLNVALSSDSPTLERWFRYKNVLHCNRYILSAREERHR